MEVSNIWLTNIWIKITNFELVILFQVLQCVQGIPCPPAYINGSLWCCQHVSDTFPFTLGLFVEPVGSARPKFPTMDNSRGFVSRQGDTLTLPCPAQGFPVPSHRWDKVISRYIQIFRNKECEIITRKRQKQYASDSGIKIAIIFSEIANIFLILHNDLTSLFLIIIFLNYFI